MEYLPCPFHFHQEYVRLIEPTIMENEYVMSGHKALVTISIENHSHNHLSCT